MRRSFFDLFIDNLPSSNFKFLDQLEVIKESSYPTLICGMIFMLSPRVQVVRMSFGYQPCNELNVAQTNGLKLSRTPLYPLYTVQT